MDGLEERLWVKICGTTNYEDAQCAVSAGADALGFVFAPSPRRVSPAQVAKILAHLPEEIETYGVFVHPSFAEVVETVDRAGLNGVQLHASSDPALARRLRNHFDAVRTRKPIRILRVVHYSVGVAFENDIQAAGQDSAVDGVLIDSGAGAAQGGTGLPFDWLGAKKAFYAAPGARNPGIRLIAAGGLRPENIQEAISTLHPWGVDVVSGVEAVPGRKDPDRVRAFLLRARSQPRYVSRAPQA